MNKKLGLILIILTIIPCYGITQISIGLRSGICGSRFFQTSKTQHFNIDSESHLGFSNSISFDWKHHDRITNGLKFEYFEKNVFIKFSDGGLGGPIQYAIDYKIDYFLIHFNSEFKMKSNIPIYINFSPYYGILIKYDPSISPHYFHDSDFGVYTSLNLKHAIHRNLVVLIENGYGIGLKNIFISPHSQIEGIVNSINPSLKVGIEYLFNRKN